MIPLLLPVAVLVNLGSIALEFGALAGRPTHGIFPGMMFGMMNIALFFASFQRQPAPSWVRPLWVVNWVLIAINIVLLAVYVARIV